MSASRHAWRWLPRAGIASGLGVALAVEPGDQLADESIDLVADRLSDQVPGEPGAKEFAWADLAFFTDSEKVCPVAGAPAKRTLRLHA